MKTIREGKHGGCPSFFANLLAQAFIKRYSLALEEALLELLEHSTDYPTRISAYCALQKRYEKLSFSAQEKLKKFKEDKRNESLVTFIQEQYGI